MKNLPLLFLFCLTVLSAPLQAQNQYYVSPNGSGSACSISNPCSIGTADATLLLGTSGTNCPGPFATGIAACVHLLAGTYASDAYISHAGTSTSSRVRWVGARKPVVGGISNTKFTGGGALIHGSYIDWVWTEMTGSHGFATYNPFHENRVLSNYIHDIGPLDCPISGSGLYINSTSSPNEAINPSAGSSLVDGNIVDRIHDPHHVGGCQTDGIYATSKNNTITNNLASRAAGWGIHTYHAAGNEIIVNNTVFNNARGGIEISNSDLVNDYNSVNNNIIINNGYNGGQYGLQEFGSGCTIVGPHNKYANNMMFGNSPSNVFTCPGNPTAVGTVTSGSVASIFVNYTGDATGDYNLKPGNAAIGAGTMNCAGGRSNCVPPIDFAGVPRPIPLSIGAFESHGGADNHLLAPSGLTATVQ